MQQSRHNHYRRRSRVHDFTHALGQSSQARGMSLTFSATNPT